MHIVFYYSNDNNNNNNNHNNGWNPQGCITQLLILGCLQTSVFILCENCLASCVFIFVYIPYGI